MKKRLLRTHEAVNIKTLDDMIYIAALNIEDGMLTGGAEPGKDYKLIDLYQMAIPLAITMYSKRTDVGYTTGYPADHPNA